MHFISRTPTPPRPQTLTLRNLIVPSIRSELRFQSRLGGASTGQVARVQISIDDGSSWRELYAQPGNGQSGELNFVQRSVSLEAFAGHAVQLRFEYGFAFGGFNYVPGADAQIGWYIDDIQVTFAEELTSAQRSGVSEPEFAFVPSTAQTYLLMGGHACSISAANGPQEKSWPRYRPQGHHRVFRSLQFKDWGTIFRWNSCHRIQLDPLFFSWSVRPD